MLMLMKIIQNLHKPGYDVVQSPANDFLHKVYWSGKLVNTEKELKLKNALDLTNKLVMD